MLASTLLWLIYFPLLKLIHLFVFWVPPVFSRWQFEQKNEVEPLCRSFNDEKVQADYCFEFSSEGEYQQVASLIDDALVMNKKVELVFFSPSVEKAIIELARRFPKQVRYLRYPLVRFSPWHSFTNWISAKELIMVRYDLFPEFLLWSMEEGNSLQMLWMSFKKERALNKQVSWFKKSFLKQASRIVYASAKDQDQGLKLGYKGSLYDFRIEQIRRRMERREEKLIRIFPEYIQLKALWEKFPRHKRLIIGNAWPSDLKLLTLIPDDVFVMVVPHKLEPVILKAFRDGLSESGRTVEEVNPDSRLVTANTLILNMKGILCELYQDFGKAYVGGGFEGSIHSVLEPLVAGANHLSCGPAHHRSTEFDLSQSYGHLTEVNNESEFRAWLDLGISGSGPNSLLNEIVINYPHCRREVLSC